MFKNVVLFFITGYLSIYVTYSQDEKDSLILKLHLKFGKDDLELGKKYVSTKKDTLQIDVFKFYISNIEIQYSDKKAYNPTNSYHLIDIENPNSLRIPIGNKNNLAIKNVFFNIGIDSTTSVSGALAGDLDPTKGMYWAWQSGYINMKIEGKSSSCKTRKNEFQFHIGGYMKPSYAIRKVQLEAKNQEIDVSIDVSEFFSAIKLSKINSIMIPGKEAMELADYSIKMFKIE